MLMPTKPLSPTELKMTSRDLGRIPGSVSGPVVTKAIHMFGYTVYGGLLGVFKVKDLYLSPTGINFSLVSTIKNRKK